MKKIKKKELGNILRIVVIILFFMFFIAICIYACFKQHSYEQQDFEYRCNELRIELKIACMGGCYDQYGADYERETNLRYYGSDDLASNLTLHCRLNCINEYVNDFECLEYNYILN